MSIELIKEWGLPTNDPVTLVQAAKNHDPFNGRHYSVALDLEQLADRITQLIGKTPELENIKHGYLVYGYALQETLRGERTGDDLYKDVIRRTNDLIKQSPWSTKIYDTYKPDDDGKPKVDALGKPKQAKGAKRKKAIAVYREFENQAAQEKWSRSKWIELLMEKVGMTKAGASTYYAGLKKGTMK